MALKGNINEVPGNLFDYDTQGYSLVHCIGADFKMKDGISKYFDIRYQTETELRKKYGGCMLWSNHGCCIITNNNGICNLVVKDSYYNKTKLERLREALVDMKEQCETRGIYKLAMPYIGCGFGGLDWNDVKQIIIDIFASSDFDIKIVYLEDYIKGEIKDPDLEKINFGKDRKAIDGNLEHLYY